MLEQNFDFQCLRKYQHFNTTAIGPAICSSDRIAYAASNAKLLGLWPDLRFGNSDLLITTRVLTRGWLPLDECKSQSGDMCLFTCRRSATILESSCLPRTEVRGYRMSSLRDCENRKCQIATPPTCHGMAVVESCIVVNQGM